MTVPGQVTSVVPTDAGPVGVLGTTVVRVGDEGRVARLAAVRGAAYELRPDANGGVYFLTQTSALTSTVSRAADGKVTPLAVGPAPAVHLYGGRSGPPVLVGATKVTPGAELVSVRGPPARGVTGASLDGAAAVVLPPRHPPIPGDGWATRASARLPPSASRPPARW